MDASVLTERKKEKTLRSFYNIALNKEYLSSFDDVLSRRKGGIILYEDHKIVSDCCACIEEEHFTIDESIFFGVEKLLEFCANTNQGPTKSSRLFYIWFTSITMGYNWIQTNGLLNSMFDTFDFSVRYPLNQFNEQFVWMNRIINYVCSNIITGFPTNYLLSEEKKALDFDDDQQLLFENSVKSKGHYSEFISNWNAWYAYRQLDGFVSASIAPTAVDLPNGSISLEVSNDVDPSTYPQPLKWTPLKIGTKVQKYLTFRWNDVLTTGLTLADSTAIKASANAFFPSSGARETEIGEVITITNSLSDEQKVIAEFWAGGPGTVSPPGMFIYLWKEYNRVANTAHTIGLQTLIYSGFDLALHLFETGRYVWGLKYDHMQARPIQEIRRLYRGISVTKYDGTVIDGKDWLPYQTSDFVTPPFADFPSGHSAFSKSFANVMNIWFGSSIPNYTISYKNLKLICPLFESDQTNKFGSFTIKKGTSEIQHNVVPSDDITLSFNDWNSLATSAGISRKYGGIHATSAHTSSVALANELHNRLKILTGLY